MAPAHCLIHTLHLLKLRQTSAQNCRSYICSFYAPRMTQGCVQAAMGLCNCKVLQPWAGPEQAAHTNPVKVQQAQHVDAGQPRVHPASQAHLHWSRS